MNKVSKDDVAYVALLSRLFLSEEEQEKMTRDLNNILGYVEKLNELDTKDIPPTSHAIPFSNVFREDVVEQSLSVDDALANAPESEENCFKVPKIIQEM